MWLSIGITIAVILLITILIAVCEVWCKVEDIYATLSWLITELYKDEKEVEE